MNPYVMVPPENSLARDATRGYETRYERDSVSTNTFRDHDEFRIVTPTTRREPVL